MLKDMDVAIASIPATTGLFILKNTNSDLYVKSSENLQRFIALYTDNQHQDKNIQELANTAQAISYKPYDSLIEAFIDELFYIDKSAPQYNNIIKPWYHYVYLGINHEKPPYIKVCDETIQDFYYIGPFRSSFALNDVLDAFASIFKLPRCTDENFPCDRLETQLCLGYCQNPLGEALPEMLNRLLMLPNLEAISKLQTQHDALQDNLDFQQADDLQDQITLLKRYYKNLLFSYTSQFITGEFKLNDMTLFVKDGLIQEIVAPERYLKLTHPDLSYRKNNELIAYNKSEYDHRWIVFSFIYNTMPEYIDEIFKDNVIDVQKELFSKT